MTRATVAADSTTRTRTPARIGWALVAAFFLLFLVTELTVSPHAMENRSLIWSPILFGVLPDIALLLGSAPTSTVASFTPARCGSTTCSTPGGLAPVLMLGGGLLLPHSPLWLGGLAWMSHIGIDRTLGFGPRDPTGRQRGA